MVFTKRDEGYNVSDSGNWNVASDFSRIKIMKPLDACDHYENIARFGYDTILDQVENYGVPIDTLKLMGYERFVNELLKLCGNCRFAMKLKGTREKLEEYEKELRILRECMPVFYSTVSKQKGKSLKLNDQLYYKALEELSRIKSSINEPLNQNHLIFTDKKEFDPQEYKKQIIEDVTHRG